MARVPVVLYDEEEGHTIGGTFFREVSRDSGVGYFKGGYALPDYLLDHLVDMNIEYICLIEPYHRLTSVLTDWQDFGKEAGDGWTGLSRSLMTGK